MANKTTTKSEKLETAEEVVETKTQSKKEANYIPTKIDNEQLIVVKNGFQGTLIYKSSRTGEIFTWDSFGSEQEMELRELKSAKNTYKKFFINNWFMFEDDWVVDYLGLKQYYKNAIPVEDFDDIFDKPANELGKFIETLSDGQKQSVAYRAKQLIAEKKIDSLKTIDALQNTLNIELIER